MRDTVRYALPFGRSASSPTGWSCGATSRGSSTSARGASRAGSVHRELALHARRPVVVDRAVELVGPRLEVALTEASDS